MELIYGFFSSVQINSHTFQRHIYMHIGIAVTELKKKRHEEKKIARDVNYDEERIR